MKSILVQDEVKSLMKPNIRMKDLKLNVNERFSLF